MDKSKDIKIKEPENEIFTFSGIKDVKKQTNRQRE